MVQVIVNNLNRAINLLETISEEQYKDTSVGPYYSSVGGHIRHIMDVYDCFFDGFPTGEIDLTARKRNPLAEQQISVGIQYTKSIIKKLKRLKDEDLCMQINVSDDLGEGKIKALYTVSSILIQVHGHTTHHYASIGYIIYQLGIELQDDCFGFNPTTPSPA